MGLSATGRNLISIHQTRPAKQAQSVANVDTSSAGRPCQDDVLMPFHNSRADSVLCPSIKEDDLHGSRHGW